MVPVNRTQFQDRSASDGTPTVKSLVEYGIKDLLRNAPKGPRNMTSRVIFESGRQGQNHQNHPQFPSNGQSSPRPLLAPPGQVVQRIGPLPPDHPLQVEIEELKETRKRRQYYWVGLIEDLGEDEWENLANYDRQRWEEENRLADQRFEELAGQIKLAEMGIIEDSARPKVPLSGGQEYNKPGSGNEKTNARKALRLRTSKRRRRQGTNPQAPSNQLTGGQHFKVSKVQQTRPSPNHPRGSILWTEDKKMEAVQHWMDEIGMNRNPLEEAHENSSGLEMMVDTDEIMSDSDYARNHDIYHKAMSNSPLQFQEQDELAIKNTGNRTARNSRTAFEAVELSAEPLWTAEEDAIFEEAEAAREAYRSRLAQLMTVQNERCGLIEPPETARLARDEHASNPPTKDIAIPRDIGTIGATTEVADPMAEPQGQNPLAVMPNQAERTTPAGYGESVMDALLVQLGTSQLSLRDLALAATRDVEEPPLSTIMADEGNQSGVTAAAGLIALAHSTTWDTQKPARPMSMAQEGEQSEVVPEEGMFESGLAESQILADLEQSLVGTPTEEQPDVSGVDDLRALALAAAQGVVESEEPYAVPTMGEQMDAFTLEDLRALALAATEDLKETKQTRRGQRSAEKPAALTVLDMQASALSAVDDSGVPGLSGTRASDEMTREVTTGDSVSTVPLADRDQVGAEMIVKESRGGFQIRPVAADFMDIDMVAVETVDMRDVPGPDAEISGQLAGDSDSRKRSNGPVLAMKSPPNLETPSITDKPQTLYVGILPQDITRIEMEELFSGFHM